MDERFVEMADSLTAGEIDAGIARARKALPKRPPDFDGSCTMCGEDVPEERLATGAITCVPCQIRLEQRARLMKV